MHKIVLEIRAKVTITVDDGVEMSDLISGLDIVCDDHATVEDFKILSSSVTDAK